MKVEAKLTAANTFSDSIAIPPDGLVGLSISGSFSATVTVQRYLDGWKDVEDFTSATEKNMQSAVGLKMRVGVKTGNYTSGTVEILMQS